MANDNNLGRRVPNRVPIKSPSRETPAPPIHPNINKRIPSNNNNNRFTDTSQIPLPKTFENEGSSKSHPVDSEPKYKNNPIIGDDMDSLPTTSKPHLSNPYVDYAREDIKENIPHHYYNNNEEEAEDTFETIPESDLEKYEEDEDYDNKKKTIIVEDSDSSSSHKVKTSDKKNNRFKDKYGKNVFVDENNLKIKPFGSSNSRKFKEHDYDERTNEMKTNKILTVISTVSLIALACASIYGLVKPNDSLTENEIVSTVNSTVNNTGFPVARGGAFVESFMQQYLTYIPNDKVSQASLDYFYTGDLSLESGLSSSTTRNISATVKQEIKNGPVIYDSESFSEYSARYTVGALVETSPIESSDETKTTLQWQFFNVNVYYDNVMDSFSILKDSPSVIPSIDVQSQVNIPESALLGDGSVDEELTKEVSSVVRGYLEGYVKASKDDYSMIDQYIISNPPTSLKNGLNNNYVISGGSESIQFEAYKEPETGNVKVLANVTLENNLSKSGDADSNAIDRVQYVSTYVITLEKQDNGKYLVSKIAPKYYVKSDEAVLQEATEE